MKVKGMENTEVPTNRCLNCGYVPRWGHLDNKRRYVPGSWACPNVLANGLLCQNDPFWGGSGFNYNNWYSKEYSDAYRAKYGDSEWQEGVSETEVVV